MHLIITGEAHSGKTSWCSELFDDSRARHVSAGGILCPGIDKDGARIGYDVINLLTGTRMPYARLLPLADFTGEQAGGYRFSEKGVRFATEAIERSLFADCELVFIDEIGPLEIKGGGVLPAAILAYQYPCRTMTVVRHRLVPGFIACLRQFSIPPQFDIKVIRPVGAAS